MAARKPRGQSNLLSLPHENSAIKKCNQTISVLKTYWSSFSGWFHLVFTDFGRNSLFANSFSTIKQ